jgi:hypothetical protein
MKSARLPGKVTLLAALAVDLEESRMLRLLLAPVTLWVAARST